MKTILSTEIITEELSRGAIFNDAMEGFREDYLVLHCLIRKYPIKRIFEIGTNEGRGTKIIKNAIWEGTVVSLDLPVGLAHRSKQSPLSEGKDVRLGHLCDMPYVQAYGDSMEFQYNLYLPLDAFFIDGEHDYKHVYHESKKAIECNSLLIVWHDADIQEVFSAITDAFLWNNDYELFRVTDTRIAYALKK